ncbi:chemotaxis protein CheB [Sphingomonas abietis]|uniref:protein-glutamate methylesterase n=1 Tax=Sphingomonas abietis TaxID=3012344 RepID=A0ABY7NKX2_9SPHN|nr:chemotaxis protein CheB [Sphingomonas abietis]WBO21450.1 response regulator [Sphingomonas abietis]
MIVDDSIVARSVFQTIIAEYSEFEIVATASTADQALARLDSTRVDIVLLDLAMPGMDPFTALPEIIARGRGARVLIVSTSAGEGADACIRALTLGASDTLEKPTAGTYRDHFASSLVEKLRRIGESRPAERDESRELPSVPPPAPDVLRGPVSGPVDCLAIGASTGGLHALLEFFSALPASCDMPILITQHLPASFMPYFAAQMTDIAGRPATVARDGVSLLRGQILVAPGDAHIGLRSIGGLPRIFLNRDPAPSACMPSVDPMLEAVARHFRERAFGVILTGMGRDGSIGARDIVATGGELAAQDRASSVVWGMPGSIAMAGLAATIARPAVIARRIADRIEGRSQRRSPLWR